MNRENCRSGFSLMELMVVLGILGMLAGLMVPAVGVVRERAQRAATAHQLRQLGLAVTTLKAEKLRGKILEVRSLEEWIETLARKTEMNSSDLYLYPEDPVLERYRGEVPERIAHPAGRHWRVVRNFNQLPIGVAVVAGVSANASPETPLLWTRGLRSDGRWAPENASRPGVYGQRGGYVVFMDGRVEFFENLNEGEGKLVDYQTGEATGDISRALPPGAKVYDFKGRVF